MLKFIEKGAAAECSNYDLVLTILMISYPQDITYA
jgi:hypothetical protein